MGEWMNGRLYISAHMVAVFLLSGVIMAGAKKSSPPKQKSAPKAPGFLFVTTTPPTMVSIDGKVVGASPIKKYKLRQGTYKVDLENPVLGIFATYSVKVKTKSETRVVKDLWSKAGGFGAGTQTGTVTVTSWPRASLKIDGTNVGKTPLVDVELSSGSHKLTLKAKGVKKAIEIMVDENEHARFVEKLNKSKAKPKGTITIGSSPPVSVWIDAEKVGSTPVDNLAMPVGTHLVELLDESMGLHEIFIVVVRKKQETTITRDFDIVSTAATLTVITRPESEVSINGRWIGNTPVYGHVIAPGSYELSLSHDGSDMPYTEDINLESGASHRVFQVLKTKGPPLLE
jgi:hypothetical protein